LVAFVCGVPSGRAAETAPAADEIVKMKPVNVTGGYFDYRIVFDRESNRVKVFEITWVAPKLEKTRAARQRSHHVHRRHPGRGALGRRNAATPRATGAG
jgi:hypothetical protein